MRTHNIFLWRTEANNHQICLLNTSSETSTIRYGQIASMLLLSQGWEIIAFEVYLDDCLNDHQVTLDHPNDKVSGLVEIAAGIIEFTDIWPLRN